jgi:hypothetical protein
MAGAAISRLPLFLCLLHRTRDLYRDADPTLTDRWCVAVTNAGAAEETPAFTAAGDHHRQRQQHQDRSCARHFMLRLSSLYRTVARESDDQLFIFGGCFLPLHAGTAILASRCA